MGSVVRTIGTMAMLQAILVIFVYSHLSSCNDLSTPRTLVEGVEGAQGAVENQIVSEEKSTTSTAQSVLLTTLPSIDLPAGTTSIILNFGANIDPIIPSISDGPCAVSIAFEPLVHSRIEYHPQLFVIPAAVSATRAGMATMYDYGGKSVSSSLSQASRPARWNGGNRGGDGGGRAMIVPILRLSEVLEVIPRHIPISHILTDVQGHDFDLIQSGIALIRQRNVTTLKTEVFLDQKSSFKNVDNDLCLHWLPLMTKHGYVLETLHPPRDKYGSHEEAVATCRDQVKDFYDNRNGTILNKMKEWDAHWRLDIIKEPFGVDYFNRFPPYMPKASNGGKHLVRLAMEPLFPNFTKSEYAQCYKIPKQRDKQS